MQVPYLEKRRLISRCKDSLDWLKQAKAALPVKDLEFERLVDTAIARVQSKLAVAENLEEEPIPEETPLPGAKGTGTS